LACDLACGWAFLGLAAAGFAAVGFALAGFALSDFAGAGVCDGAFAGVCAGEVAAGSVCAYAKDAGAGTMPINTNAAVEVRSQLFITVSLRNFRYLVQVYDRTKYLARTSACRLSTLCYGRRHHRSNK
jgi:hypothetical protein